MNSVILDQLNRLGLTPAKEIVIPKKIGYNFKVGQTYKIRDGKEYIVEIVSIDGSKLRLNGVAVDNPLDVYYKLVDRSSLQVLEKVI